MKRLKWAATGLTPHVLRLSFDVDLIFRGGCAIAVKKNGECGGVLSTNLSG